MEKLIRQEMIKMEIQAHRSEKCQKQSLNSEFKVFRTNEKGKKLKILRTFYSLTAHREFRVICQPASGRLPKKLFKTEKKE